MCVIACAFWTCCDLLRLSYNLRVSWNHIEWDIFCVYSVRVFSKIADARRGAHRIVPEIIVLMTISRFDAVMRATRGGSKNTYRSAAYLAYVCSLTKPIIFPLILIEGGEFLITVIAVLKTPELRGYLEENRGGFWHSTITLFWQRL